MNGTIFFFYGLLEKVVQYNEFLHLPSDDKDEPKVDVKVLESLRSLPGFTLH